MIKIILILSLVFAVAFASIIPEKRIVGGNNVNLGQVTSMVSIRSFGTTTHFAGGVLISSTWVLTGAFYMVDRTHTSLNIVVGIINLASTGTLRHSNLITIHPNYSRQTRENDIACIRMAAVAFTMNIQPIHMSSYKVTTSISAHVSGWGGISPDGGSNSELLRRLEVQTALNCQTTAVDGSRIINVNSHLCAQGAANTGFCTSDVGGPLIALDGLIGIASWHRSPCGSHPDVYVRISYFRNWIRSITTI